MRIIYHLEEIEKSLINPVLTIGNFDGVHKGHLVLFDKVKNRAKAIQGQSVVMTFDPHPIKIMHPGNGPALITPISQKLNLITKAGIDIILCITFTREFAAISAKDFVQEILVNKIGIKELVVGYNYSFGKNRQGNIDLLEEMSKQFGFNLHVMAPILIGNQAVSSTSIRERVREGNFVEAKKFLGRDYQICGTVIKGKNRGGRLLGFPTANLKLMDELVPKGGVYAVHVMVDDKKYDGVTNIGYNPTFSDNALSIETHLLGFTGDLVGKTIKINFIERLRDEKRFNSVQELADQITQDIYRARESFQRLGKDLG